MDKLLKIINEIREFGNKENISCLEDSMDLWSDLDFDSFDLAELTVKVEKEFGTDIFSEEIVRTIGEIKTKLGL